IVPPS
ncbi:hypothetical protein AB1N83_003199, partial [Pleurotus pulmonarius]